MSRLEPFALAFVAGILAVGCSRQQPVAAEPAERAVPEQACVVESEVRLTPPGLAPGDIFGAAVAIDGDVAFVGCEYDDDKGYQSGSVFVYRCNGERWKLVQKLRANDGEDRDNFARSLSLEGTEAAVGAHFDDDNGTYAGAVYVFRNNGQIWRQHQKLIAADGQSQDRFGNSVSLSGEVLGVAAWLEDEKGLDAGAAYMFRRRGKRWVQEQKLTASDGSAGDRFGRYISVDGNVAVIGAFKADAPLTDSGAAYVFRYNGQRWVEEQKLVLPDGHAEDGFGWATAVGGDVAMVSCHLRDDRGANSGSVYVYRFDGTSWNVEQEIESSDAREDSWFGYSLSYDGGCLLVGAPVALTTVAGPGSAYLFHFDGEQWVEEKKLTPTTGAPQDEFGFHLSLSGNTALVGAWRDDGEGQDAGVAYLYGCDP